MSFGEDRWDRYSSTFADVAVNLGCVFSRSELLAVVMRS